jgi:NADPH:quinone reductase-like Zn-dependent oxidoreductase
MKAIIYNRYGSPDVLALREAATPAPGEGEVLIRVLAASINAADRYLLRGRPLMLRFSSGLRRPKRPILGADVAGRVAAVGLGVRGLRPGDAVIADLSDSGWGGLAEYAVAPESAVVGLPVGVGFVEAAAVPMAAVTALQGLHAGGIRPGARVLVHGASGGVGHFAVQIARALDAEVTAVCSARHAATARAGGAARVIDYAVEDFAAEGPRYDLILAVNGNRSLSDYRRALVPGGVCVVAGGGMGQIFAGLLWGPVVSARGDRRVRSLTARHNPADMTFVGELMATGQVRPVIERCFPLAETAEALRLMEAGHVGGKVVVVVAEDREGD